MALAIISAVAEKLRHQLDVGRFAAARASARRIRTAAGATARPSPDPCDRTLRSVSGIFRKKSQLAASASRRGGCATMLMARCFTSLLLFAGQTSHAQGAAGAILGRHLQGVLALLHVLPARRNRLEGGRRACQVAVVVNLGADHAVRADQHAFAALDAQAPRPIRESPARYCAFPTARWPSGKCRRWAWRSPADRRLRRR